MKRIKFDRDQVVKIGAIDILDNWSDGILKFDPIVKKEKMSSPVISMKEAEKILSNPDNPLGHSVAVEIDGVGIKRVYPKYKHHLIIEGKNWIFNTRKGQEIVPVQKAINSGKKFSGTIFKDMELSGLNGRNANFSGALFENCILTSSHFEDADLTNCVFKNCDLYRTCFKGSNLDGAVFENSVLSNVDFTFSMAEKIKGINNIYDEKTLFSPSTISLMAEYSASIMQNSLPQKLGTNLANKLAPYGVPVAFGLMASTGMVMEKSLFTSVVVGLSLAWCLGKAGEMVFKRVFHKKPANGLVAGVTKGMDGSLFQKIYGRLKTAVLLNKISENGLKEVFFRNNVIVSPVEIVSHIEKALIDEVKKDVLILRFGLFKKSSFFGSFSDDKDPDIVRIRSNGSVDAYWTNSGVIEQCVKYDKFGKFTESFIYKNGEIVVINKNDDDIVKHAQNGDIHNIRCCLSKEQLLKILKYNVTKTYGLENTKENQNAKIECEIQNDLNYQISGMRM